MSAFPPPADPRLIETLLRYLDRQASPEQLEWLSAELRSAGGRRQVASVLLLMGQLRELPAGASGEEPAVEPLRAAAARLRRPRVRRLAAAGACLAVAAAAAVVLLAYRPRSAPTAAREGSSPAVSPLERAPAVRYPWRAPPPPAIRPVVAGRITSVVGPVRLVREREVTPARAGENIDSGTGIELLVPQARATVILAAGSVVELEREAQVTAVESPRRPSIGDSAADRLLLQRGTVTVTSALAAVRLVTPLSEIVVAGRARLSVTDEQTRAEVREGSAQVTRLSDGLRVVVAAGSFTVVTESSALRASELPQAVLVQGSDRARGATLDRKLAAEIEAAGLVVVPVAEDEFGPQHLAGKALVVISSTTTAAVLPERLAQVGLREAPIPVVACENASFPVLGMAVKKGAAPSVTDALVEAAGHPLAAGHGGRILLAERQVSASWGQPGPEALRIVSLPGRRRIAVFAYERGAAMLGLDAPARRVSCFLDPDGVSDVSHAGWDLFAAAVRWAAGR